MFPGNKYQWLPGVLSKNQLHQLMDGDYIGNIEDFDKSADYSSIDLHISDIGYRMVNGSIKPYGSAYRTVLNNTDYAEKLIPNEDGFFLLSPSNCYVFELKERLHGNLSGHNIFGQATAKSSIGRLDIIARLIVDGMSHYEYFDASKLNRASGNIFLEIIPISFGVMVKEGVSLSQLRLFYGAPEESIIRDKNFIKSVLHGCDNGDGYLTVDIKNTKINDQDVAAFCACNQSVNGFYINIGGIKEEDKPCPEKYWRFVKSKDNNHLKLENGKFYILRSKERIDLPSGVAVYAKAMDETLGEMRIHYAGFVHPFFGKDRQDKEIGTPLIFEVRAHNVDVILGDGERLAKLIFYRMSEFAEKKLSENPKRMDELVKYNNQELLLSKYFGDWPLVLDQTKDDSAVLNEE